MLKYTLLHPGLLAALAGIGHGSKILIADGNYPHATGVNPAAQIIHLNLRPGLIGADDVLDTLLDAIEVEMAEVMVPDDGRHVPALAGFRARLGNDVPWTEHGRFEFYAAAEGREVGVVIATGETRVFANLLLTVGVRSS